MGTATPSSSSRHSRQAHSAGGGTAAPAALPATLPTAVLTPEMYAQLKLDVEEILDRACVEIGRRDARLKQAALNNDRLRLDNDRLRREVARLQLDLADALFHAAAATTTTGTNTSAPTTPTDPAEEQKDPVTGGAAAAVSDVADAWRRHRKAANKAADAIVSPPPSDSLVDVAGRGSGASEPKHARSEESSLGPASPAAARATKSSSSTPPPQQRNPPTTLKRPAPDAEPPSEDEEEGDDAAHWVDVIRRKWPIAKKGHEAIIEMIRAAANQFIADNRIERRAGQRRRGMLIPGAHQEGFLKYMTAAVGKKLDDRLGVTTSPPPEERQPPPDVGTPDKAATAVKGGGAGGGYYWTMAMRNLWPSMAMTPTLGCRKQLRSTMVKFFESRPDIPEADRERRIVRTENMDAFLFFMDARIGRVADRLWPRAEARSRRSASRDDGAAGPPQAKRRKLAEAEEESGDEGGEEPVEDETEEEEADNGRHDKEDSETDRAVPEKRAVPWSSLVSQLWPGYRYGKVPTLDSRLDSWTRDVFFAKRGIAPAVSSSGATELIPDSLQRAYMREITMFFGTSMGSMFSQRRTIKGEGVPSKVGEPDGDKPDCFFDIVLDDDDDGNDGKGDNTASKPGTSGAAAPATSSSSSSPSGESPLTAWTDVVRTRWPSFVSDKLPQTYLSVVKFRERHNLHEKVYTTTSISSQKTYGVPAHLHAAFLTLIQLRHGDRLDALCGPAKCPAGAATAAAAATGSGWVAADADAVVAASRDDDNGGEDEDAETDAEAEANADADADTDADSPTVAQPRATMPAESAPETAPLKDPLPGAPAESPIEPSVPGARKPTPPISWQGAPPLSPKQPEPEPLEEKADPVDCCKREMEEHGCDRQVLSDEDVMSLFDPELKAIYAEEIFIESSALESRVKEILNASGIGLDEASGKVVVRRMMGKINAALASWRIKTCQTVIGRYTSLFPGGMPRNEAEKFLRAPPLTYRYVQEGGPGGPSGPGGGGSTGGGHRRNLVRRLAKRVNPTPDAEPPRRLLLYVQFLVELMVKRGYAGKGQFTYSQVEWERRRGELEAIVPGV